MFTRFTITERVSTKVNVILKRLLHISFISYVDPNWRPCRHTLVSKWFVHVKCKLFLRKGKLNFQVSKPMVDAYCLETTYTVLLSFMSRFLMIVEDHGDKL